MINHSSFYQQPSGLKTGSGETPHIFGILPIDTPSH